MERVAPRSIGRQLPGLRQLAAGAAGRAAARAPPGAASPPPTATAATSSAPPRARRRRRRAGSRCRASSRARIEDQRSAGSGRRPRRSSWRTKAGARVFCAGSRMRPLMTASASAASDSDGKRTLAVQRLVQRHAEAELIGARVGRRAPGTARAPCRAACRPAARSRVSAASRVRGAPPSGACDATCLGRGAGHRHRLRRAGEAEVHHAHRSVAPDHHVLGLEVAVHEPGRVRGREPRARRDEHVADLRARPRRCRQPGRQRLAVDELHREEDAVLDLARVVDRDHVRVRQARDRLRLAQQARRAPAPPARLPAPARAGA